MVRSPENLTEPLETSLFLQQLSLEDWQKLSSTHLAALGLRPRVYNRLMGHFVWEQNCPEVEVTLSFILSKSPEEILKIRQFGPKCLEELKEKLREYLQKTT